MKVFVISLKRVLFTALLILVSSISNVSFSQGTLMPIGPQAATFSSMVRGYYFTAPANFTICGLYIPTDASTASQNVEVVRFTNGAPPAFAATTNSFVSLFYQANYVPNTIIPCNIPVNAGDIIGIYGARGAGMVNSYNGIQHATNILGFPVTLYRSGMQANLSTQQMANIWSEINGRIGRIEMYYNCCAGSTAPSSVTASLNPINCGDSTVLTVNGGSLGPGANWYWYTGGCGVGTPIDSSVSITVRPNVTTTYYVRAESSCNITTCDSITITVNNINDATWTNPSPICQANGNIILDSLIIGTTGGTWSGTGVTGNVFDPSNGTQTIKYIVGTSPCQDSLVQTITVIPTAIASWNNPSPICEANGNIILDSLITGTNGGTWSGTGVNGNVFDPSSGTQTITYIVGTSPCQDTLTQTITVNPDVDPSWTNPSPICSNGGLINLDNLITGTTGGTWSGPGVSGNFLDPSALGNSSINITYTVGTPPCVESQSNVINIQEVTAQINASPESGISPLTVTFGNGSSGATSYFWDFNNGNTDTTFSPTQTFPSGTYQVMLIATNGLCYDTAYVTIEVVDKSSLIVPNVFTPNGDGKNDQFDVIGVNLKSIEVAIYDRWGLELYSWNTLDGFWSGETSKGKKAADGTYYYVITAEGIDGEIYSKKGSFSLIR
jgi:gliding motility-associated-like protein